MFVEIRWCVAGHLPRSIGSIRVLKLNSQFTVIQPDTIQKIHCIRGGDTGRKLNEGKRFLFPTFFITRNMNAFDRPSLKNQNYFTLLFLLWLGVMYSGENDVSGVTVNLCPHQVS